MGGKKKEKLVYVRLFNLLNQVLLHQRTDFDFLGQALVADLKLRVVP